MLVPYMKINLFGITLQWNFVNLFVFLVTIIHIKTKYPKYKLNWEPLIPFVLYFLVSLIIIPLQFGTPYLDQLNAWRFTMMQCMILPFAIWNTMRVDNSSVQLFRIVMIFCIFTIVGYGLFLTTMPGINPYITIMALANGEEFNEAYALAENGGRLFGRISSVFTHPMSFGLFIGFATVFLFFNKTRMHITIFTFLLVLLAVDSVVCGVRSCIGGLFCALIGWMVMSGNYIELIRGRGVKYMLVSIVLLSIIIPIISQVPELESYFKSMTLSQSDDIRGSSIETRINQLWGCFVEIQDSFVFGKGFNWTGFYVAEKEFHPTILCFESLIFVVLCNSGLVGVLLWFFMLLKISKYNKRYGIYNWAYLNTLLVFYLSYATITGEYGYMQYYILFYILMLGETISSKKESKILYGVVKMNHKETSCRVFHD